MDQKASEPRLCIVQENAQANTNRANGASKQSTKAAASAAWSIPWEVVLRSIQDILGYLSHNYEKRDEIQIFLLKKFEV